MRRGPRATLVSHLIGWWRHSLERCEKECSRRNVPRESTRAVFTFAGTITVHTHTHTHKLK